MLVLNHDQITQFFSNASCYHDSDVHVAQMFFDKKTDDDNSNIWIVELRGYMHDKEGSGEDLPLGRIKIIKV